MTTTQIINATFSTPSKSASFGTLLLNSTTNGISFAIRSSRSGAVIPSHQAISFCWTTLPVDSLGFDQVKHGAKSQRLRTLSAFGDQWDFVEFSLVNGLYLYRWLEVPDGVNDLVTVWVNES